ncbi:MAG: UbiA family prenyltransferase [Candidatus Omnitrophica bacterium]|nr:UbiA family prenyltransferase [Candidatus Omnitrophota bacterium]
MIQHLKTYMEFVKFEHTIFALPFAYLGAVLAQRRIPPISKWFWITLAMVGARTAGMALNRIIDRKIDTQNPRTKDRALQKKTITLPQAKLLVLFSLFLLLVSAWQLNPFCIVLAPLAIFLLFTYSYVKRFSWSTHFILGSVLACAPIGGWVAIEGRLALLPILLGGSVLFWVAGFDMIYACQDVAFDRTFGIHSLPARFGVAQALFFSTLFHLVSLALLLWVGFLGRLGPIFWLGWALATFILLVEHRLISPQDLSRVNQAFFVMNGWVSVILFIAVTLDQIGKFR